MRIPRGFSQELRNQADILRVIGDYVSLKKKGANYWACCPFHQEKTASFSVNPAKQFYKCFGCGKAGDVISFVMEIEGSPFPEAVKTVADKCGISIPQDSTGEESREFEQLDRQRADLLQINQLATEFFEKNLLETSEGKRALNYLAQRGIDEETRKMFRLGYSPNSWDALSTFLHSSGATRTQIERSGLVKLKDNGSGYYDRFRSRLIFPISDAQGRMIAFGGRIIGDGEPKYLNSPETVLYTKGKHLFGLHQAREAIRRKGYAILVEGYLDFLIPFQYGVKNLVASLGTALTENQVRLLGRYARQIIVNFDPDSAGIAATKRSLELLLAEGFKANVLTLPDNLDPDEYIRRNGSKGYLNLLKDSKPFLEYIVETAINSNDQTKPSGKVETINAILPYLKLVKDQIGRAEYFEQIADRLKLDTKLIREEFKKAADTRASAISERVLQATIAVKPAERKLLEIMLSCAEVRRQLINRIKEEDYEGFRTAQLFRLIIEFEREGREATYPALTEVIDDEELARELLPKFMTTEFGNETSGNGWLERAEREADESLYSLRCAKLAERQAALQTEINHAQRTNDSVRLGELMMLKYELAKKERAMAQRGDRVNGNAD
jgi:DNA primase